MMTDDELNTSVKEHFTEVHMNTPVEQIITRGRAVRVRRRLPRVAGAAALAAAATAVAVTALPSATHQPGTHPDTGGQPGVRLAAWTVAAHPDGDISITIRELRDPAGLQDRLRADGVPASVTFSGHQNRSCRNYGASAAMWKVFPLPTSSGRPNARYAIMTIHPSLPANAGVYLSAGRVEHPSQGGFAIEVGFGMVRVSHQCTGS